MFALLTALALTYTVVSIQWCVNMNFDLLQANYDGWIVLIMFTFPAYWYELYVNEFPYTVVDTVQASAQMVCIMTGAISMSYSVMYGVAASSSAIENSKTIIQTLYGIIFLSRIPNWL